jgi:membrane protein
MSSEAAAGLGDKGAGDQHDQSTWKAFGLNFYREFKEDDLTGMAAEIAYHLLFAIPPLIILVVMVTAMLNQFTHLDVVSTFHRLVNQHAPGDLKPVLNSVVNNALGKISGGAATFGALFTAVLALWSGSNGIGTMIKGFNRAEDASEVRPFVKKKLLSLGLTLALIVFIIVSFALFVFGREIGNWLANQVGLGPTFSTTWNIVRWPAAVALVMLLIGLLYYFGPAIEQTWRSVAIGAVVATLLWIAAVFGFKVYLSVSNPGSTYGAFGGLIVFLLFLYVTALIFLIGSELNAQVKRYFQHEMAGAPISEHTLMHSGSAHEVIASDAGATRQLNEGPGRSEQLPRSSQSPRGPASKKEPT